jgi:hypothetical protein
MLRFVPDSWLEILLRPFLLADPVAGLYAEIHAPDWRFALLFLFLLVAKAGDRKHALLNAVQWRALIGMLLAFYLWTVVSGNGRYFLWGLLLVGPLVVLAARRMPATLAMRNTAIVGALALQGWVVAMTYEPNVWTMRPWGKGPGVAVSSSELAQQPAVFVTIGTLAYSILVPQMHPQSRWTNLAGQQDLVPGMPEWPRLQALLASPLPKYGVVRASKLVSEADSQPNEAAWVVIRRALQRQGLAPTERPCHFVRVDLGGLPFEQQAAQPHERGFWFCELVKVAQPEGQLETQLRQAPEWDDVFAQVERRCPRYFPPGNALTRINDDGVSRNYKHSDTSVSVNLAGGVYFKNLRAMNPTELGSVQDVRAGRFQLDCDRLPGRYRAPWVRGWAVDLE